MDKAPMVEIEHSPEVTITSFPYVDIRLFLGVNDLWTRHEWSKLSIHPKRDNDYEPLHNNSVYAA